MSFVSRWRFRAPSLAGQPNDPHIHLQILRCAFCVDSNGNVFHTASRNRCRDLTDPTKLVILKRLLDFGVCVHYKRTSANDWLVERFSVHNKKLGIGLCLYCDMIASAGEDCEIAFGYIRTVGDSNLATQYEKDARVPIGQWKFCGFSSAEIYIPQ